jgi:DNA-binding XRE family transcriptional regulator
MARHPRTYLRTRRQESGLSQKNLAMLVGLHRDSICDYEREKYPIPAKLIVAGEIIFGVRAHELFPAFYKAVQDEIGANAVTLYERLANKKDAASRKKRALLEAIPNRTKTIDL